MILFHDDMGTQINTFFSPDIFEELFVPQYQKITKTTHELGMYICLHSCGCVGRLLPLFIRSGFDAWEGQDNANDKKALMDAHGKELASPISIKESMSSATPDAWPVVYGIKSQTGLSTWPKSSIVTAEKNILDCRYDTPAKKDVPALSAGTSFSIHLLIDQTFIDGLFNNLIAVFRCPLRDGRILIILHMFP